MKLKGTDSKKCVFTYFALAFATAIKMIQISCINPQNVIVKEINLKEKSAHFCFFSRSVREPRWRSFLTLCKLHEKSVI